MYLVINKCVTAVKVSNFSGHYLRNRSTLHIGVLGYIGIVQHKERSPEVLTIPPGTPCISVTALRRVYVSLEGPLCPSICLYAGRIFTPMWRNFAKKKKLSTNLLVFFIRDHFTCVYALRSVPISALRVPNFCHAFDPHTSCENLTCQKWKLVLHAVVYFPVPYQQRHCWAL